MWGLSDDDLSGITAEYTQFLPETATVARTGASLKCRVDDETTQIRLPGLTSLFRVSRWRITFASTADVQVGDRIVVAGKGTYVALLAENPNSYSVNTVVHAVQTLMPDGVTWPHVTNATVTFISAANRKNRIADKPAIVIPMRERDGGQTDRSGETTLQYAIYWQEPVAYDQQGTQLISQQDQILWTGLRARQADLGAVIHWTAPFPYGQSTFNDDLGV